MIDDMTAIIRLLIMGWVFWDSYRHRDTVGCLIAFLYALSVCLVTIGGYREYVSVIATPLVFLLAWHVYKSHRRP